MMKLVLPADSLTEKSDALKPVVAVFKSLSVIVPIAFASTKLIRLVDKFVN